MNKMLIVEDDFLSQKILKRIFAKKFIVDICDSAEEYYRNYVKNNYAIIIMDISLKGSKNGVELIREIKAIKEQSNTPILCLTANAFMKDRKTATDAGADLFITKPVANEILKNAVNFLISQRRNKPDLIPI